MKSWWCRGTGKCQVGLVPRKEEKIDYQAMRVIDPNKSAVDLVLSANSQTSRPIIV